MTKSHRCACVLGVVALLLCLTMLQACFTTGLWGGEVKRERDPLTGEYMTSSSFEGGTPFRNVWVKIALTPFAVCLDCLTLPAQAVLYGKLEE